MACWVVILLNCRQVFGKSFRWRKVDLVPLAVGHVGKRLKHVIKTENQPNTYQIRRLIHISLFYKEYHHWLIAYIKLLTLGEQLTRGLSKIKYKGKHILLLLTNAYYLSTTTIYLFITFFFVKNFLTR